MTSTNGNYREILENQPGALIVTAPGGEVLEANEEARMLLGHGEEDLLGRNFEELVTPGDEEIPVLGAGGPAGEKEPSEALLLSGDGTEVRTELRWNSVEFDGEERFIITLREVSGTEKGRTETEKSEAASEGTTEGHPRYFDELGDAVFITRVGGENLGQILDANAAATEQTGYSRDELVGMNMGRDLSVDPPEMGFEKMDEEVARGEMISFTEKKRKKDGTVFWTEVMVTPIDYRGGKASLSINRDITERKRMEERLKQYKLAIEGSEELIFACDKDYNYLIANQAYRDMYGLEEEELSGKKVQDLFGKEEFQDTVKPRLDSCLQGERTEYEMKRNHPELGERNLRVVYYPLEDEDGIQGIVGVLRDITERKESERKFESYWEHSPVGGFLLDEEGYFRGANPAVAELTGYSREELVGMSFRDILTPESLESAEEAFGKLLDQGEVRIETTYLRKDGDRREVIVNAVEASRNRYLAFTLDVTRRKEAERKMEQSKERLEAAMKAGNLTWWRMELPSGELTFSDNKARMLGYTPEKFESHEDFTDLIHPEDLEKLMNASTAHIEGEEEGYEVEYRIQKKNGDYKWFRDVGSLTETEGEYKVITGVTIDIDQRKEAELALKDQRSNLEELHEAVDRFQECNTEEELCRVAVQVTRRILEFDRCIFYCVEGEELVPMASEGVETEGLSPRGLQEGLAGKTYQKRRSLTGENLAKVDMALTEGTEPGSYLSVPVGDVGVLQVSSRKTGAFDENDKDIAEILAGHLHEEVKRIRLEEELKHQATRDPLTGLYNRRYFNETLKREVQQAERYDKPLAFLMVDINEFKAINDRYSHRTGDEVLQVVADLLRENFRGADTVVRYGGDEFLIMMPETDGEATEVLNRLDEELDRWNEESDLLDNPLVLATGLSHWNPDQERDVEEALNAADKKMYEDKKQQG